jgi:hypothetical protein
MSFTNGFAGYSGVNIDPTTSLIAEFNSLALQNNWKKTSAKYKKQRSNFVKNEFEAHFGSNLSGLGGWQALCEAVGIEDVPSSIIQCKKVRRSLQKGVIFSISELKSDIIVIYPAAQECRRQHLRPHRRRAFRCGRTHIQQCSATGQVYEREWQGVSESRSEAE